LERVREGARVSLVAYSLSMRRWLSRFTFSLFALAFVFIWQGYRLAGQQAEGWRIYGCYALAVVCASLALAGARERHRRQP
jgi:hypothetical protein